MLKEISDWYKSNYAAQLEALILNEILDTIKALPIQSGLQMGVESFTNVLSKAKVIDHYRITPGEDSFTSVLTDSQNLPVPDNSMDCVVSFHDLDTARNPHQLLREVDRIMSPSGYLVMVGFNQVSLLGFMKLYCRWINRVPWKCSFHSIGKLKDWLSLLNFDIYSVNTYSYFFPFQSEKLYQNNRFFKALAVKKGQSLGNLYVVIARKRTIPLTPKSQKKKSRLGLATSRLEPSSRIKVNQHRQAYN